MQRGVWVSAAELLGCARLELAEGVVPLNPQEAVFEGMLAGWARQQRSRFLREDATTALAAWASDLPPAVLASLLGVHIQTAVNWASHTRRDWTTYLAERVRVGTPAPRKTARPE